MFPNGRRRPYVAVSDNELNRIEGAAWEDIGVGIGVLVFGLAGGLGAGIPLGLASEHRLTTLCEGFLGGYHPCVGYDTGLLGGAIVAGALGIGLVLGAALGVIRLAADRRTDVERERRQRAAVALDVTSDGAAIVWRGTF